MGQSGIGNVAVAETALLNLAERGDVDEIGSLRAMKESGYEGYVNFEYEGSDYTPRDATIEGVRRLRGMISSLE